MPGHPITLTRHILEQQAAHPQATGEFSTIMAQIALAAKMIARDMSLAGIIDVLGKTGAVNVQGEVVQKLDEKSNAAFVHAFEYYGGIVRTLVSEEMERPLFLKGPAGQERSGGRYAVFLDPLDGSSNLDGNLTVGSIFSIHRVAEASTADAEVSLLKAGREQVAAGYVLYGPGTVLVYSAGHGAHQFTLDPAIGEFVLSGPGLRMPQRGNIYSVNEGNYHKWQPGTQRLIDYFREKDPPSGRPYSTRYSGCLVADVHRFLSSGGIYLYPAEAGKPDGKLRLMYEAAPLAFVIEQAGGAASTGTQPIMDVRPSVIHQRVPLVIGSREEVALAEEFIQGRR
jgi:fructose-1,6-bisphosphatase I